MLGCWSSLGFIASPFRSPSPCFSRWVATFIDCELDNEDLLLQKPPLHPQQDALHSRQLYPHDDPSEASLNTYVSILHSCISSKSLSDGMVVHTHLITHGFEHHELLGRLLLDMYTACRAMPHAHGSSNQSLHSWNALIKEHVRNRQKKEAMQLFKRLEQSGLHPDNNTFIALLSLHTQPYALDEGRLLHFHIVEDACELDRFVNTALVNMYGKCDDLESAWRVYEEITVRDVVVWNALISAHVHHGKAKEALHLLEQMLQEGMIPNKVTFISLIAGLNDEDLLFDGQKVHSFVMSSTFGADVVIGTGLVNMYGKCRRASDAQRVFDNLIIEDDVPWNALIGMSTQHGLRKQALQLLDQMHQEAVLSSVITFVNVLDACVEQTSLVEVKRLHTFIWCRGFHTNVIAGTALMSIYGKRGALDDAYCVLESMPVRDLITWNAMLAAHALHDEGRRTPQLLARMLLEGVLPCKASFCSALSAISTKDLRAEGERLHVRMLGSKFSSDTVLANALVNLYGKCDCADAAQTVFEGLLERDAVSWNALIAAYARLQQREKAWELFEQMRVEGFPPDRFTCVSILDACKTRAALIKGKQMHCCIIANHLDVDVLVGSAVVTMYGKCGSMQDAEQAFECMPRRNEVSWNAMLANFAQHGEAKQAINYFNRMKQEFKPNRVTFTILLTACSHTGLVDEAWDIFSAMMQVYGVEPTIDHFSCMIDMLGRVGRLAEAEDLLKHTPFERNAVLYTTLLSACMQQNDVERGKHAASVAMQFDENDPTPLVALGNLYSSASKEATEVSHSIDIALHG